MDDIAEKMAVSVLFVAGILIAAGISLGIMWLVWLLWLAVLPAIYPTGPQSFLAPSYWPFVGMWVLGHILWRGVRK